MDTGDTAWILTSSALVFFMTPGLAFFYGGMVRTKNALAMFMKIFAAIGVVTVTWTLLGFSLAFGDDVGGFIGNLKFIGLFNLGTNSSNFGLTIPDNVFMVFQMMFAIIAPALIAGAVAERMKFNAWIIFIALWSILVYSPIAHMVWGGGFIASNIEALDFAGGLVVHINAGAAALAAVIVLGKRKNSGKPVRPSLVLLGAGVLWFGWFGFNAGSALAADGIAANAFVTTQIAAATAAICWNLYESLTGSKPSTIGFASGAVAGLVAITPAAGFVTPFSALLIGVAAGVICPACIKLKNKFNYDDSLDVVAVHLIGGIIGSLMLGLLADVAVNGAGANGLFLGNATLLMNQILAIIFTIAYSFIFSFMIIKVIDKTIGIRVSDEIESSGLDIALHGEDFASKE
ncbi:MAG: ammonium transporter, Amt family [Chloroflexi bacterium]|jgi:Amt family ammonium transporter|nr:MAG: ammonium transporter, Amt family [Chloroflexota bacterium]|tara:strand:- start:8107 stop:9315 length:1209 start_codon:yes stop_codon:yes gene_type:complete